jgi:hypothetical protein
MYFKNGTPYYSFGEARPGLEPYKAQARNGAVHRPKGSVLSLSAKPAAQPVAAGQPQAAMRPKNSGTFTPAPANTL